MLKSCFVEGTSLDDVWFKLLVECYKHGRINKITYGSYAGAKRLEFDFMAGTIYNPTIRPLSPIMPQSIPPVTTDEEIEKYFINYIMDGINLEKDEHYRYATWITGGLYKLPYANWKEVKDAWFDHDSLYVYVPDQLKWCIDHYKLRGFGNNHCCIQVGYPESCFAYDIPWETEADRQTSPCLRLIDTHIKNGKLCFAVTFRSWDLYSAFPQNMGGIIRLMEFMANELEVEIGSLSFSCLKAHTYDFCIEPLKIRLNISE